MNIRNHTNNILYVINDEKLQLQNVDDNARV